MVRRTYRKKRKVYRKKRRVYKRKTFKSKRKGNTKGNPGWNPQYFKIKRTVQLTGPPADVTAQNIKYNDLVCTSNDSTVSNATNFVPASIDFMLSDIPNFQRYYNMFDQYMISGISVTFQYMNATGSVLPTFSSGTRPMMRFLIFQDNDDDFQPSASYVGWQNCLESGRARVVTFPNNGKNRIKVYLKNPKCRMPVLNENGLYGYAVKNPGWQDLQIRTDTEFTNATYATYNGFKILMAAEPTNTYQIGHTIRVTATYYVKFKHRNYITWDTAVPSLPTP